MSQYKGYYTAAVKEVARVEVQEEDATEYDVGGWHAELGRGEGGPPGVKRGHEEVEERHHTPTSPSSSTDGAPQKLLRTTSGGFSR